METGRSGDCIQSAHTFSQLRTLGTVLEQDRPVWLSYYRLTYTEISFTSNFSHTQMRSPWVPQRVAWPVAELP